MTDEKTPNDAAPDGNKLLGEGTVIGKRAPDFVLPDQDSELVRFSHVYKKGPVLLAFYPGDFTAVCTKQLCNYRDHMNDFLDFGIQILGVSSNASASHHRFAKQYEFPFRLLSDEGGKVAARFDCRSIFLLGKTRRAVFIVNTAGLILYRYIEPTVLTRRSADELVKILADLKSHQLL